MKIYLIMLVFACSVLLFSSEKKLIITSANYFQLTQLNPAFIELGDYLVFLSEKDDKTPYPADSEIMENAFPLYLAMSRSRNFKRYLKNTKIIVRSGNFALFTADSDTVSAISALQNQHFRMQYADFGKIVSTKRESQFKTELSEDIKKILIRINETQAKNEVQALVDYKTRYTFCKEKMKIASDMEKRFQDMGYSSEISSFGKEPRLGYNVIGIKSGSSKEKILVVGHIDSTSGNPMELAPGADDNASGAAGVLLIADALKDVKLEKTVCFILFSGEEQGMLGSKAYLSQSGNGSDIKAVFNMDMISFYKDNRDVVILETEELARQMVETMAGICSSVGLKPEISYHAWGSDHEPFLDHGIPAVLTIEKDWDDLPGYHSINDTMDHVHPDYMIKLVKLDLASLLILSGYKN